MIKLTNPKVAHADAVISLAKRLLKESQRLLNELSQSHPDKSAFDDLIYKVQFHVVILHKMLQDEYEMITSEISRVSVNAAPGSMQNEVELQSLKEKTVRLLELVYLTEQQRSMTLQTNVGHALSLKL